MQQIEMYIWWAFTMIITVFMDSKLYILEFPPASYCSSLCCLGFFCRHLLTFYWILLQRCLPPKKPRLVKITWGLLWVTGGGVTGTPVPLNPGYGPEQHYVPTVQYFDLLNTFHVFFIILQTQIISYHTNYYQYRPMLLDVDPIDIYKH